MKKIYEKPIFIKTMYISTDTIANMEPLEIESLQASLNVFEGWGTTAVILNDETGCTCQECPGDSDIQVCKCSTP